MSITNLGNQYITFDYKHPAKGSDFNTLLREGIKPGVYSGGDISITGGNTISVAPFVSYLNTGIDKLVRVETRAAVPLTITESTPVLAITYDWQDVTEDWLDWNQRAHASSPITNEVCLGEMVFSGGVIVSIDYSDKTWGLQYDGTLNPDFNADQVDGCDVETILTPTSDDYIPTSKAVSDFMKKWLPAGVILPYMFNDDPATLGYRILPLQGSVLDISDSEYNELVQNTYCGDANNGTAPAFYKTSDAGGTTRSTAGTYMVLPNTRAVSLKGVGDQTINTRVKTGPASVGSIIEDTFQGHRMGLLSPMTAFMGRGTGDSNVNGTNAGSLSVSTGNPVTDGINDTPRTGTQTQDCTIGTNFGITY